MADTPEHDGEVSPRRDRSPTEAPRGADAIHDGPPGPTGAGPGRGPTLLPFPCRAKRIGGNDLGRLLQDHARLRALCNELETFADGLPAHPPLAERRTLADTIESATIAHVRATSAFLGRFFSGNETPLTRAILSRILVRQIADAMHAEDTGDVLRMRSLTPASIDMLSYMLRFLFEGARRAVELESLFLLSLGSTRLTRAALTELERALA
ncbi:hypothetical protein U1701_07245 [Sphingomonas sp. PB2P19]|uniref:hypothetical protein n=1 Tax=Sphingomonas rhamnosi TaxID=3096156 RepID=UPI002FCA9C8F